MTKLCVFLHPEARIEVYTMLDSQAAAAASPSPGQADLCAAFARGTGFGLLMLARDAELAKSSPELSFLRRLACVVLRHLCNAVGNADALPTMAGLSRELFTDEQTQLLLDEAPVFPGAPLDGDLLVAVTERMLESLAAEVQGHGGDFRSFLRTLGPTWAEVGRVCIHLAENRRDPARPFAFLVTFAQATDDGARLTHQPIGRALQQSVSASDRAALARLLKGLKEAAAVSPWLAELVESGAVYRPLFWTPAEAHCLLRDAAILEAAGLGVRVPDWWRASKPPRPKVKVRIGEQAPSRVGLDALLAFDIKVALGDEELSAQELKELKDAGAGLVFFKGRWVEVDPRRLEQVLEHWTRAQQLAAEGVPFHSAMRLLAGVTSGMADDKKTSGEASDMRAWSDVIAGDWLAKTLKNLSSPARLAEAEPGPELHATPRPYQQAGIVWLWMLNRMGLGACLADDMGLGKTLQIIGFLLALRRAEKTTKALIVMPASLLGNWSAELARFAPSFVVEVAHASASKRPRQKASLSQASWEEKKATFDLASKIVLTSYGTLLRDDVLQKEAWDVVVLDEAQAIKNASTLQARVVKKLKARQRIALTGTPIENGLNDLWSIFDFINPGLLGAAAEFRRFQQEARASDGESTQRFGALRRLVQPYLLRRLKSDKSVVSDLPEKIELSAWCSLAPRQAAAYQRAVDALAGKLKESKDDIQRRGMVLASLMRFKQICNHPSQASGDLVFKPEDSGKMQRLAELVISIKAARERVLVFTQFREMTAPLAEFLSRLFGRDGLILHGDTPVKDRAQIVSAFQAEQGPPFLVLSLKAGGVGLNLTAAAHVIHFDRWWNPAIEAQATDRAYRIGQKSTVMVHKLITRGTIEERIDALLSDKRGLASDILGTGKIESRLSEMSDAELLSLVDLDLNSVESRS